MAKKASTTTKKPASKTRGGKTTSATRAEEPAATKLMDLESLDGPLGYRGELLQLSELIDKFPRLSAAESARFLSEHSAEACRELATDTKAADTFRGAMTWVRSFAERGPSPGLHPKRVRWFLDCATALGGALAGQTVVVNPSEQASYSDTLTQTNKVLSRSLRKLKDAAGSSAPHLEALATAKALPGTDQHSVVLRKVATLATQWLKEDTLNLALNDVDTAMVKRLQDAAKALDAVTAKRRAPRPLGNDSPLVNELEGRLLCSMRPVWNDLSDAREDGLTDLVPQTSSSLGRGLGLRRPKKKKKGIALPPS